MMEPTVVYGTRRKRQWVLSQSPDFPLHRGNRIINTLVDRVLKLEPDAKTDYKFFRGEPRIAKVKINHSAFSIVVKYEPPYAPVYANMMSGPSAEITAELKFNTADKYDAKKRETLTKIVRKL
jgi:hypothetical protein